MSPEQLLREAWRSEILATWVRKTTTDPAMIPCSSCSAEAGWDDRHCRACGREFDPGERRFRARLYESLLWGEDGCAGS